MWTDSVLMGGLAALTGDFGDHLVCGPTALQCDGDAGSDEPHHGGCESHQKPRYRPDGHKREPHREAELRPGHRCPRCHPEPITHSALLSAYLALLTLTGVTPV